MTVQSRYADQIVNSSDVIKNFIKDLPAVSSLWILYQFVESFEAFEEEKEVPFKDWLIQLDKEQVEELEHQLLGLTMGTVIDMEGND